MDDESAYIKGSSPPGMRVSVMNGNGNVIMTYQTVRGFQIDDYVRDLFPDAKITLMWDTDGGKRQTVTVRIYDAVEDILVETHEGIEYKN